MVASGATEPRSAMHVSRTRPRQHRGVSRMRPIVMALTRCGRVGYNQYRREAAGAAAVEPRLVAAQAGDAAHYGVSIIPQNTIAEVAPTWCSCRT